MLIGHPDGWMGVVLKLGKGDWGPGSERKRWLTTEGVLEEDLAIWNCERGRDMVASMHQRLGTVTLMIPTDQASRAHVEIE